MKQTPITSRLAVRRHGLKLGIVALGALLAAFVVAAPGNAATGSMKTMTVAQVAAPLAQNAVTDTTTPVKPQAITPNNLLGLSVTINGVNMRACASTSCAVVGTADTSNTLRSWCYVSGQTITNTPYWDIVFNATTGRAGFITEYYLTSAAQASTC
jgi:hypothetical protein